MKCLTCERVIEDDAPHVELRRPDTVIAICEPCLLVRNIDLRDVNIVATFYEFIADPSIAGENGGRVNAAIEMLAGLYTIQQRQIYRILQRWRPKYERVMATS